SCAGAAGPGLGTWYLSLELEDLSRGLGRRNGKRRRVILTRSARIQYRVRGGPHRPDRATRPLGCVSLGLAELAVLRDGDSVVMDVAGGIGDRQRSDRLGTALDGLARDGPIPSAGHGDRPLDDRLVPFRDIGLILRLDRAVG